MGDQQTLYSLAEASRLTGLSTEALRLRIKRGKLSAERGNDGHPRVRLTAADLEEFARQQNSTLNRQKPTESNENKALGEAVGLLREQLAREQAALTELRQALASEQERVRQAEATVAEARERAGKAEGEAEALKHAMEHFHEEQAKAERRADAAVMRAQEAERAVAEAQEELGRLRSRGLLSRILNRDGRG